ncbi:unnamed protein product, partial [Symbiodinium sp. CCMP2456]
LGGDILWLAPTDVRRVLGYRVYLSTGLRAGQPRSLIGSEIAVGATQNFLPAESAMQTWTHVAVFTRSQLVEQTTPAGASISDTSSSVSAMDFPDDDLDQFEIGGLLSWKNPSDFSEVIDYEVYLAEDSNGTNRSYLGNVSVGTNSFDVPAETGLQSFSHLVVYTRSPLVEQSTPEALRIIETVASVSAISFVDLDLDTDELGGRLLWQEPASTERVEFYVVYLALDSVGTGGEVPVGTQRTTLPTVNITALDILYDTPRQNFSHLVIYTRSSLAEQTTPVAAALSDTFATVSNVTFADYDLDATDIGGPLTWDPPGDVSEVVTYIVYLARA